MAPSDRGSNFLFNASLFQDVIGQVPRHDEHGDRKSPFIDLAKPHLVTALTMAHEPTALCHQDAAPLWVVTAAHVLPGNARRCILKVTKLNATGTIKSHPICQRNLRRYFPKSGGDSLIAHSS